jgi:hypothetical protein
MKVLFKNFRVKSDVDFSLKTIIELLHTGTPEVYSDSSYEEFYGEFIGSYRELPDHDVIFPEEYLHIGLVVMLLWESEIRDMSDIDLFDMNGKASPLGLHSDLQLTLNNVEIIEEFCKKLDKYYTYDRD